MGKRSFFFWCDQKKRRQGDAVIASSKTDVNKQRKQILSQDPFEAIVSFICSSNTTISRITQLVDRLRMRYGRPLAVTSGYELVADASTSVTMRQYIQQNCRVSLCSGQKSTKEESLYIWFAFPTLDDLASLEESELRALGFGYRAASLCHAVQHIINVQRVSPEAFSWTKMHRMEKVAKPEQKPDATLASSFTDYADYLSTLDYQTLIKELMALRGIGRKVADCIALLGFQRDAYAVPVDTHVRHIAKRMGGVISHWPKSLSKKAYHDIANLFRQSDGSRHAARATLMHLKNELKRYAQPTFSHAARVSAVQKKQQQLISDRERQAKLISRNTHHNVSKNQQRLSRNCDMPLCSTKSQTPASLPKRDLRIILAPFVPPIVHSAKPLTVPQNPVLRTALLKHPGKAAASSSSQPLPRGALKPQHNRLPLQCKCEDTITREKQRKTFLLHQPESRVSQPVTMKTTLFSFLSEKKTGNAQPQKRVRAPPVRRTTSALATRSNDCGRMAKPVAKSQASLRLKSSFTEAVNDENFRCQITAAPMFTSEHSHVCHTAGKNPYASDESRHASYHSRSISSSSVLSLSDGHGNVTPFAFELLNWKSPDCRPALARSQPPRGRLAVRVRNEQQRQPIGAGQKPAAQESATTQFKNPLLGPKCLAEPLIAQTLQRRPAEVHNALSGPQSGKPTSLPFFDQRTRGKNGLHCLNVSAEKMTNAKASASSQRVQHKAVSRKRLSSKTLIPQLRLCDTPNTASLPSQIPFCQPSTDTPHVVKSQLRPKIDAHQVKKDSNHTLTCSVLACSKPETERRHRPRFERCTAVTVIIQNDAAARTVTYCDGTTTQPNPINLNPSGTANLNAQPVLSTDVKFALATDHLPLTLWPLHHSSVMETPQNTLTKENSCSASLGQTPTARSNNVLSDSLFIAAATAPDDSCLTALLMESPLESYKLNRPRIRCPPLVCRTYDMAAEDTPDNSVRPINCAAPPVLLGRFQRQSIDSQRYLQTPSNSSAYNRWASSVDWDQRLSAYTATLSPFTRSAGNAATPLPNGRAPC